MLCYLTQSMNSEQITEDRKFSLNKYKCYFKYIVRVSLFIAWITSCPGVNQSQSNHFVLILRLLANNYIYGTPMKEESSV